MYLIGRGAASSTGEESTSAPPHGSLVRSWGKYLHKRQNCRATAKVRSGQGCWNSNEAKLKKAPFLDRGSQSYPVSFSSRALPIYKIRLQVLANPQMLAPNNSVTLAWALAWGKSSCRTLSLGKVARSAGEPESLCSPQGQGLPLQKRPARVKSGKLPQTCAVSAVEGSSAGSAALTSSCQLASTLGFKGNRLSWHGGNFTISSCSFGEFWTQDQWCRGCLPSRGSWAEVYFPCPFLFPPSLYSNDKWSGGLKYKNWSHE